MDLNETLKRAQDSNLGQAFNDLGNEEKLVMGARAVFLLATAVTATTLAGSEVETNARVRFLFLVILGIAFTSFAMAALTNIHKIVRIAVHALDTIWIVSLAFLAGGANNPFYYLLPLMVVPGGLFVAVEYGIIIGMLLLIFELYKIAEMNAAANSSFVYFFWVAYYAFGITLMIALLAGRMSRRNRFLYVETGKQNINFEQRVNRLEKDLSEQKITDELTGLNNFRYFRTRLKEEIQRAERYKYKFTIAAVGVDTLDEFEKNYGALERDKIVMRTTQQLRRVVRDTDQLARYTKDQFMVMFISSDARQSIAPARRIAASISSVQAQTKKKETFPASFGIACFPDDAEDVNSLIGMAVAALEKSRERGNGKITLATALYKKIIPG